MNQMIRANTLRPDQQATPATADILSYAIADCDLGKVLVARSERGVCSILLGDDIKALTADLATRFPQATLVPNEVALKDDLAKILGYVAKPTGGLHLTLDMQGTPFQRRVWERLTATATGRTVTYTEVALGLIPLSHPRAVAGACAANPIALAVPCHRVVRSDGDLAGYRWGLARKRVLIEKEATA
jgi:AraC family transcriptional regulator, regulatory protein of adaptative response / methylated-DNA-[protein]-cysteine methyltransferase